LAELVVLGSSSGAPSPDRFCSAYALVVRNGVYLLDCGAPMCTLLLRAGLEPLSVEALLISHWHVDHVAGLPLLLSQLKLLGRTGPLQVLGPPGTQTRVDQALSAMFLVRSRLGYECKITEASTETWYRLPGVSAMFYLTTHLEQPKYSWLGDVFGEPSIVSYGMVVRAEGTKLVYSGDCGRPEDAAPHLAGADLLIHELGHHQPADIARFAQASRVPRLLLSHIPPAWGERREEILDTLRRDYGGEVIFASDGTRVSV
jgi:ribonuclease Z